MRTRYVDIDDRMEDLAERMRGDPESRRRVPAPVRALVAVPRERAGGRRLLEPGARHRPRPAGAHRRHLRRARLTEIRNHKAAIDLVREEARAKKLKLNPALSKRLYETLGAGHRGAERRGLPEGHAPAPGLLPRHRPARPDRAAPAEAVRRLRDRRLPEQPPPPAGHPASPRLHAGLPVHRELGARGAAAHEPGPAARRATSCRSSSTPPTGSGTTSPSACRRRRCAT